MAEGSKLLAALRRYARVMADEYELTDVLHQLTAEVTDVLGIAGAGIVVPDEDGRLRSATASDETVAVLERRQEADQVGPCVEAFEILRTHARNNNTGLRTVAQAVVADGLRPGAR